MSEQLQTIIQNISASFLNNVIKDPKLDKLVNNYDTSTINGYNPFYTNIVGMSGNDPRFRIYGIDNIDSPCLTGIDIDEHYDSDITNNINIFLKS